MRRSRSVPGRWTGTGIGNGTAPWAEDTDSAEAPKVLTRAHQDLIWRRQDQINHLRKALREHHPTCVSTTRPA
jgi:hypothetical protein